MLEFGNKEFRNLQEQVEKNKEDIKTLKGGIKISAWLTENQLAEYIAEEHVGNYVIVSRSGADHLYVITKRLNGGLIADDLGVYPPAIEGPEGPQGPQGEKGEAGREILAFGRLLPRAENYENGQLALLTAGPAKGRLSKVVDGEWVTQCSLIGPQGPIGQNGTEVVGNPDTAANDTLTKIKVSGVTYKVNSITDADKEFLDSLREVMSYDEATNTLEVGTNLYIDGEFEASDVHSTGEIMADEGIKTLGYVRGDSVEAETTNTDVIKSDTSTSLGQKVEMAHFDSNDNHWHQSNTKFDDTPTIKDEKVATIPSNATIVRLTDDMYDDAEELYIYEIPGDGLYKITYAGTHTFQVLIRFNDGIMLHVSDYMRYYMNTAVYGIDDTNSYIATERLFDSIVVSKQGHVVLIDLAVVDV